MDCMHPLLQDDTGVSGQTLVEQFAHVIKQF
jgi:hypothetical protein